MVYSVASQLDVFGAVDISVLIIPITDSPAHQLVYET